jgi:hypothetical protein
MDASVWLQIETKVRSLVKDLIEPTVLRVTDSVKQIEKLGKIQNTIVFKLEDVDSAVIKIGKKISVIDEFFKKLLEFESVQAVIESKFSRYREEVQSQLSLFLQKQVDLEENFGVFQHQREDMRNEITFAVQAINANKLELDEKIIQLKNYHKDLFDNLEHKVSIADIGIQQIKKNYDTVGSELIQTDAIAKESLRISGENSNTIKEFKQKMKLKRDRNKKDLEKIQNMAYANASEIQKNIKEVSRIESIIKNDESSFKNELIITEPLYHIIKDLAVLKELALFDLTRLEKFNNLTLSENLTRKLEEIKQKSKDIIDTPLPEKPPEPTRSMSLRSSTKKKKKKRSKLKKQIANNILQASKGLQLKKNILANLDLKNLMNPQSIDLPELKPGTEVVKVNSDDLTTKNSNSLPNPKKLPILSMEQKDLNTETKEPILKIDTVPSNPEKFIKLEAIEKSPSTSSIKLELYKQEPKLEMIEKSSSKLSFKLESPKTIIEEAVQKKLLPEIENINSNNISDRSSNNSSNYSDDSQSLIDFTPMIEKVRIDLEQDAEKMYITLMSNIQASTNSVFKIIEENKNEFNLIIAEIRSSNENQMVELKKKIVEAEMALQQTVYETTSVLAQRKRDNNDNTKQFKSIFTSLENFDKNHQKIIEKTEILSRNFELIVDYCKIWMALQNQDEIDRESISLMGYKSKKKSSVISVDKRCLSCAGQTSSVLSAFKMACLAYEPSQVIYQNRTFTRKQLLNFQTNILNGFPKYMELELSDDGREERNKTMMTSRQWRPLSVPPSRFSTITSPNIKTPDTDNLPLLNSLKHKIKINL